jgi:hypothetical protein
MVFCTLLAAMRPCRIWSSSESERLLVRERPFDNTEPAGLDEERGALYGEIRRQLDVRATVIRG